MSLIKPTVHAIIGDVNTGKSMLLYNIIHQYSKRYTYNLYYYGLREDLPEGQRVYSVQELEQVTNSLIIIDELSSLFDLDNRKTKKLIENTLRLLHHSNNILILCGTPENFKKFISAKIEQFHYKKCTLADFINGSTAKNVLLAYRGYERGSELLNLAVNQVLTFNGSHYSVKEVAYLPQYDTKKDNKNIFEVKKWT